MSVVEIDYTFVGRVKAGTFMFDETLETSLCGWCSQGLAMVTKKPATVDPETVRALSQLLADHGATACRVLEVADDTRALKRRDCALCGGIGAAWPVDVDLYR